MRSAAKASATAARRRSSKRVNRIVRTFPGEAFALVPQGQRRPGRQPGHQGGPMVLRQPVALLLFGIEAHHSAGVEGGLGGRRAHQRHPGCPPRADPLGKAGGGPRQVPLAQQRTVPRLVVALLEQGPQPPAVPGIEGDPSRRSTDRCGGRRLARGAQGHPHRRRPPGREADLQQLVGQGEIGAEGLLGIDDAQGGLELGPAALAGEALELGVTRRRDLLGSGIAGPGQRRQGEGGQHPGGQQPPEGRAANHGGRQAA